jgi:SPP1 family predicted phage head-tail adaptor
MRMDEQITLIDTTTTPNTRGVPTETDGASVMVWADKLSVKFAESYAANAAGMRADVIFRVNADDYSGQAAVLQGSTRYKVVRSYAIGRGRVELTCQKR